MIERRSELAADGVRQDYSRGDTLLFSHPQQEIKHDFVRTGQDQDTVGEDSRGDFPGNDRAQALVADLSLDRFIIAG
jgi:hypothetical protein